jgi:hypothetical protein
MVHFQYCCIMIIILNKGTQTLGPHLFRTLCVLRSALDSVPKRQWYPSCQRVYARITYELKRIGMDIGEEMAVEKALLLYSGGHAEEEDDDNNNTASPPPVLEQIELENVLSCTEYWKKGRYTLQKLTGRTKHEIILEMEKDDVEEESEYDNDENEETTNKAEDVDNTTSMSMEVIVWNQVYGTLDENGENKVEDVPLKERLTNAYNAIMQNGGKTHSKYFEMICRLSRLAMKNGYQTLVRSWIFDEENVVDEINVAQQQTERRQQRHERIEQMKKRKMRLNMIELEKKKQLNEAKSAWEEEDNEGEFDEENFLYTPLPSFLPEPTSTSKEQKEENEEIIPPTLEEVNEANMKELEELNELRVKEKEFPPIYPMRAYTAQILCKEILLIPDPERALTDAIENVVKHRDDEIKQQLEEEKKRKMEEERLLKEKEEKEAADLLAASGGLESEASSTLPSEPSTATLPPMTNEIAVKENQLQTVEEDKEMEQNEQETTTTTATKVVTVSDRTELLWLSQYQLLRAKMLYKIMTTDGIHSPVPIVDIPLPFHMNTGLNGSDTIVASIDDSAYSSLPPTSLGPCTNIDLVDVPLSPNGEELAPKNPSIADIRKAASAIVENNEQFKLNEKLKKKELIIETERVRQRAIDRGEDPDEAEQQLLNSNVPVLALQPILLQNNNTMKSPRTIEMNKKQLDQHRRNRKSRVACLLSCVVSLLTLFFFTPPPLPTHPPARPLTPHANTAR